MPFARPNRPCGDARALVALAIAFATQPLASVTVAQSCLDYPQYMHRVSGTLLPASGTHPNAQGGTVIVRDHPFAAGHKVAFALSGKAGEWHMTAVDVTDPLALDYPAGGDDELGRLTQVAGQEPRQIALDPDFPSRPYLYVATIGDPAGFLHVIEVTDPDPGSASNTDVGFSIRSAVDRWPQPAGVGLYKVGSNTYAAVSRGGYSSFVSPAILVFDVTNPAAPAEVGSLTIGAAGRVTLSGTTAYVPGQWDISAVDVANPAAPASLGFFGVAGVTRVAVGALPPHYVFAVGTSDPYLHVYNSTAPFAELASLGVGGGFTSVGGDVVASGNTLFCQTVDGVLAIDITLPTAPVLRGSAEANGVDYGSMEAYRALALAIDGNYAYAMGPQNGLQVVDISNTAAPATPPRLGGFVPGDIEVAGNLMVAANGSEFRVIDASLPEAPVVRSTTAVASNSKPVVIGHHAFLGSGCNFQSWDLTNPGAPSKVSDGAVGSCFAWLAAGYDAPGASPDCVYWGHNSTIHVVNVSNPASPSLATTVYEPGVFGNLMALEVSGGYLYALTIGGFGLWSLSTPTAPARMGEIAYAFGSNRSGVSTIAVQGSYAYLGAGNTLYVVDASNPTSPGIVGTLSGMGDIQDVVVKGTRVYVALGSAGISVVDVSNPTAPKLAGALNPTGTDRGYLYDLYVANDVVFGSDGWNGLWSLPMQCGSAAMAIFGASPDTAGTGGSVRITINGYGFPGNLTASLTRNGHSAIVGELISSQGTSLEVVFELSGVATGLWSLSVDEPGGGSATLPDAIELIPGTGPELQISCSSVHMRKGFPNPVDVLITNDGDVDADYVLAAVYGIPLSWRASNGNPSVDVTQLPGWPADWPTTLEGSFEDSTSTDRCVIAVIPRVRANGSFLWRIYLTPPEDSEGNIATLRAGVMHMRIDAGASGALGLASAASGEPDFYSLTDLPQESMDCAASSLGFVSGCLGSTLLELNPVTSCIKSIATMTISDIVKIEQGCETSGGCVQYYFDELLDTVTDPVGLYLEVAAKQLDVGLTCLGVLCPECALLTNFNQIKKLIKCAKGAAAVMADCIDWHALSAYNVIVGGASDPNEKTGPVGISGSHQMAAQNNMLYVIKFENLPTATLPARQVLVSDDLPAALDAGSVRFVGVGWGNRYRPLQGVGGSFEVEFDLRPDQQLLVRAVGQTDPVTRHLSVSMVGIDPATGLPPGDVLVGWLPPNVTAPEGEGRIAFTIDPAGDIAQGEVICNQASIVFDTNAPIVTNAWCDTFDVVPPVSAVQPLVAVQPAATFDVVCSGSDVGSGILEYDIHVSMDGGPVALWERTRLGTKSFTGQGGHTYAFYSSAEDSAGNVEPLAGTPDATTQIPLDAVDVPDAAAQVELALHRVIPMADGAGFAFDLSWPNQGRGRIALYDVAGRRLWQRVLDGMPAGRHRLQATPGVKSGVYWARLSSEGRGMTQKVVLVR